MTIKPSPVKSRSSMFFALALLMFSGMFFLTTSAAAKTTPDARNLQASSADAKNVQAQSALARFFIRVETPANFPTLPREILTVVQESLPVSTLRARGLLYDDPSEYLDLQNWNPNETFILRDPAEIKRRLTQLNMTKMLTISLSPLPGRPSSLLLTGRLMDLRLMNEILATCLEGNTASHNLAQCPVDGTVFRAVAVASVELKEFANFKDGLRQLFEKLLTIPRIEFHSVPSQAMPNEDIKIGIRLVTNETEISMKNFQFESKRKHSISVHALAVSDVEPFCENPQKYWKQLTCDASKSDGKCQKMFRHISEHKIVLQPAMAQLGDVGENLLYAHTQLPDVNADLLIRIQATADENGKFINSSPEYACIRVRDGSSNFSIEFIYSPIQIFTPNSSVFSLSQGQGFGTIFSLYKQYLMGLNGRWLSMFSVGGFVALGMLNADLICTSFSSLCSFPQTGDYPPHFSSASISAGIDGTMQLFRFGKFRVEIPLRIGLGINYLSSSVELPGLGAYGLVSSMFGIRGKYLFLGGLPVTLGLLYEQRAVFRQSNEVPSDFFALSSDNSILWLTAGIAVGR